MKTKMTRKNNTKWEKNFPNYLYEATPFPPSEGDVFRKLMMSYYGAAMTETAMEFLRLLARERTRRRRNNNNYVFNYVRGVGDTPQPMFVFEEHTDSRQEITTTRELGRGGTFTQSPISVSNSRPVYPHVTSSVTKRPNIE